MNGDVVLHLHSSKDQLIQVAMKPLEAAGGGSPEHCVVGVGCFALQSVLDLETLQVGQIECFP